MDRALARRAKLARQLEDAKCAEVSHADVAAAWARMVGSISECPDRSAVRLRLRTYIDRIEREGARMRVFYTLNGSNKLTQWHPLGE